MKRAALLLFFVLLISGTIPGSEFSYQTLNPELGVVYRTPAGWDAEQWNAVFSDPAPPMGWIVLPVGKETCNAVKAGWLNSAKSRGFRLALLLDPFLEVSDIRRGIDCAYPMGFRRFILDEYVSYHTRNLGRPLCTVISEVRSLYNYAKTKDPSIEFGLDDNWGTWMGQLARGRAPSCGQYPYFKVDYSGVSVLSKYNNPAQGLCGHPTAPEMREQLIDLAPTVRDYSKSKRIFVWQLNQNWYPGGEDVLQLFRQAKPVFGWDRYFLFGPTTEQPRSENWAYRTLGNPEVCPGANFEWYLPARQYLLRLSEGESTGLTLTGPANVNRGSTASYSGSIRSSHGIQVNTIEVQAAPAPGTLQRFSRQAVAPSSAPIALVGVRVNSQLPFDAKGAAHFLLQRVQLFDAGGSSNLVSNPEFNDGFRNWAVLASGAVNVVTDGSERSLEVSSPADRFVTITSTPIPVIPGHSYIANFDAKLLQESRLNAYFFVAWNNFREVRRDRVFLNYAEPQTFAATYSVPDGGFRFQWTPQQSGAYDLYAFFRGNRSFQPSRVSKRVVVN